MRPIIVHLTEPLLQAFVAKSRGGSPFVSQLQVGLSVWIDIDK